MRGKRQIWALNVNITLFSKHSVNEFGWRLTLTTHDLSTHTEYTLFVSKQEDAQFVYKQKDAWFAYKKKDARIVYKQEDAWFAYQQKNIRLANKQDARFTYM